MAVTPEQIQAFKAEHPALWAQLMAEGAIAAGAAAERARIQSIEQVALPGHERLIAKLKYDGTTTAVQAAQLMAEAERQQLARMRGLTSSPADHNERFIR